MTIRNLSSNVRKQSMHSAIAIISLSQGSGTLDANLDRDALKVPEAVTMLLACPSFEMLCMMTLEPKDFRWAHSRLVAVLMPRPLSECTVGTVLSTMDRFRTIPEATLKSVVDECELRFRELGSVKEQGPDEVFLDEIGNSYRGHAALEIGRKCALLLKYVYLVPETECYPWKIAGNGTLSLLPSPSGVPVNNLGNYGTPNQLFNKYSKYPRRPFKRM